MRLHWIALSGVLIACGTGPGAGSAGGPLGDEDPNNDTEDPSNDTEDPGGPGGPGPGQGGSGNTGGGDGGTGGGTGGSGGGDCNSICTVDCGQSAEICGPLCANATPDQIACAQAVLPDCNAASSCFTSGTGGTGGGSGGTGGGDTGGTSGVGGGSGACQAGVDCTGCTELCDACLCQTNGNTEVCASSCG
jgi:hypothetical protein